MNSLIFNELNRISQALGFEETKFVVSKPTNPEFGDFSTNIALIISKQLKQKPNDVAKSIVEKFNKKQALVKKVEVVALGFINFFSIGEYYSGFITKKNFN